MVKLPKNYLILIILVILIGVLIYFLAFYKKSENYKATPSPAPTGVAAWISFSDPQNRFSILLPANPKQVSLNDYTVSTGNIIYSIRIYPGIKDSSSKQLNNVIQGFLNSAGANAKLIYASHFKDASQVEYLDYKIRSSSFEYKGRMFLVKQTIYQLLNIIPINTNNDNEFNNFISSFQLK